MNKKKIYRELSYFQETHLDENYKNISFKIILIQPEHAGNIGSISRVMKNFTFKDLVVFNPIETVENILSREAQGFAMHGKEILLNSEIITVKEPKNHISELKKYLKKFDLIIATTAKGKRYTNLKRLAIFPEDLLIPTSEEPLNIAILFGKESRGLTNDEINLADIFIRIPTSNEYSSLNLSHACGIILYEIYKKVHILHLGRGKSPVLLADKDDRISLFNFIENMIKKMKIRQYRESNVLQSFKNVFERALISKKELSLMIGFFSKLDSILKDIKVYQR